MWVWFRRTFVHVKGETQFTLILPQVILHKVRILLDIDGLKRKLPETFAPLDGLILTRCCPSGTWLGTGSVLEVHWRVCWEHSQPGRWSFGEITT